MALFKISIIDWELSTNHCRTKAGTKRVVTLYLKHEKELLQDLKKAYQTKSRTFLGYFVTASAIQRVEKNIENGIKFYKSL